MDLKKKKSPEPSLSILNHVSQDLHCKAQLQVTHREPSTTFTILILHSSLNKHYKDPRSEIMGTLETLLSSQYPLPIIILCHIHNENQFQCFFNSSVFLPLYSTITGQSYPPPPPTLSFSASCFMCRYFHFLKTKCRSKCRDHWS